MTTHIAVTLVITFTVALPVAFLVRWLKQRKEYKNWFRLTDGQEATEL